MKTSLQILEAQQLPLWRGNALELDAHSVTLLLTILPDKWKGSSLGLRLF